MGFEIIALETEKDSGKPAVGLLNWKLNDVLLSSSSVAAIILPSAYNCELPLLEFLAGWSERFAKASKHFYVILGDKNHLKRLAAAHPDFALNYAASVAELKKAKPLLFDPAPNAAGTAETMAVGATVTTSAEYTCKACGKARMWLKGDSATACSNLECSDAHTGWKMTFELF